MAKRKFTDRWVRSTRPAPQGKRVEYYDTAVPCFGLRITDKGHRTYILYVRWPGSKTATRREIGNADRLSLALARKKARSWLELVELGIDPGEQERAKQADERRKREITFEAVANAWFAKIQYQRKADEVERDVEREFVARWKSRPISSITMHEIIEVIENKASTAPAQSRNLLGHIKQLFAWTVASGKYGLTASPAQLVSARAIIGKKKRRSRVLNDAELRAVWLAASQLAYPYGEAIRMLILTGQRKSEVGDATWSEFDLRKRLWIIPKARMKMDHDHLVPISDDLLSLLNGLPRFASGDHLFSTTFGARPANGYSKAKERLDKLTGPLPHWVIHDLRRSMRTNLSAIPQISDRVREVMIAHTSGMHAVYDLHTYEDEKRQGFGLWNARLRGIIAPPDDASNVVPIRG